MPVSFVVPEYRKCVGSCGFVADPTVTLQCLIIPSIGREGFPVPHQETLPLLNPLG